MWTVAASLTLVASYLCGMVSAIPKVPVPPPLSAQVHLLAENGSGTFEQYIDHNNPGLGTFAQRFWWNSEFWAGPGSPVSILRRLVGSACGVFLTVVSP
jgi:hypothetical protein